MRYRGAGAVTVTDTKSVDDGTARGPSRPRSRNPVSALRVEAMDTEIHDFHCCWSNGYIRVSVAAR